jgi:multimeric flavodoxin WrbA
MEDRSRPYVLALIGSRRRRNTWKFADSLRPALEAAGFDLALESIHDYGIRDCLGCHRCVEGGSCGLDDDMPRLRARLEGAAGVILASPVYMCGIAGKLKTAIDRSADWFHRPVLVGKPALVLVTTAGSYERDSARYLSTVAMHWGLFLAGAATRNAGNVEKPLSSREAATFLRLLREGPASFSPGLRQLALFQVQKVLARKILPVDRAFWEERGWDRAVFYITCRTSLVRRILAWTFYRILYARVRTFDPDEGGTD